MRRRTVRNKGGLSDETIKEEEEDPSFAVRRTQSKIDPEGRVDRDV